MVMTGNRRLCPDIWLEIPHKSTSTEDMILTL